jgi:uncharacterized membrane-anchored protein
MATNTQRALITRDRHRGPNKVPEVTVSFWIIKIPCTIVGESFADDVNETGTDQDRTGPSP